MLTVMLILVLLATGLTVWSWIGKAPLLAAVFVLCLIELLRVIPLGK